MNYYDLLIKRSRSVEPPAPSIPTDYVFYAPLTENLNDISQYQRTLTVSLYGSGVSTFTTVDGVDCISIPVGSRILSDDLSGISLGNHSRAICFWTKFSTMPSIGSGMYPILMNIGYTGTNNANYLIVCNSNKYYFSTWGYDVKPNLPVDTNWNCFILNYDSTTSTYTMYKNGVAVANGTNSNQNLNSNAWISLAGGVGQYQNTLPVTTYFRDALIYDRALTSSEIEAISNMVDIKYTITVQDLSCSFYQKNESFGIQYTSPAGTPTFEIISGELPNTISFNTSTGQFTGKGLTDADHVYNLIVRLTAPNSTPATCNVTIHTYMTARISITNKTFTFYRDGSESGSFTYTSDESVTFAIESGYSLPSGITMSGNTFYSDGTTTAGSYSVKVRGTSAHNQTGVTGWMYFNMTANEITVENSTFTFYTPEGTTSKQVAYATSHFAITPVYTLTGTLPAGVTFDSSTGTFTSDGTQSSDATATVSVMVASSTGLSTAGTGTIEIQIKTSAPAIPKDYILYDELKTAVNPQAGTFVEKTSNWTFATAPDGTLAACNNDTSQRDGQNAGFKYTGSLTSTDSLTCSIWCYCTRAFNTLPPDWLCPIAVGNKSGSGVTAEWGYRGNLEIPWISGWSSSDTTLRPTNDEWHHLLFTFQQGGYLNLYVDGVLHWTSSTTKTITIGSNSLYVGTRFNDGRPWVGYLRNAIIYNRVLTADEIQRIYSHGIDEQSDSSSSMSESSSSMSESSSSSDASSSDTPTVPTDYIRNWTLASDLTDSLHPTNTDYNLTQPSGVELRYVAFGDRQGCTISNGCLYNTTVTHGAPTGCAMSLWCKMLSAPSVASTYKCYVNGATGSSHQFSIGYQNGVVVAYHGSVVIPSLVSQVAPGTDWHNLVLNYDKANLRLSLWVDGVECASETLQTELTIANGIVVNARDASNSSNPEGLNDISTIYSDLKWFNRPLTGEEIQGLAQMPVVSSVRFWAGVDTTLYITNSNGVLTATPSGDWGGCGYHSDIAQYPDIYFRPKHGLKYSLDGGTMWADWIFEDTNSTLDLSQYMTTLLSVTKVSGRDTVSLSGRKITVNDPSSGSAPYVFDADVEKTDTNESSSASTEVELCDECGEPLNAKGYCTNPECNMGTVVCEYCGERLEGLDEGWDTPRCPNENCEAWVRHCLLCGAEEEYDEDSDEWFCPNSGCEGSPWYDGGGGEDEVQYCEACGSELEEGYCRNPECEYYTEWEDEGGDEEEGDGEEEEE